MTDALLRLDAVAGGYAPGSDAVSEVAFASLAGERIAVLGPNGGGKTTLFRILTGELAHRGEVERTGRCALVPQTERSRLDFPVSALDVVLMGTVAGRPWWRRASRGDRSSSLDALRAVGLADRAHASFGALSGGQRQRVLIARALVQEARVLLLDEPFSGLDAPSSERLERLIVTLAGEGRAVLIATHSLEQAQACDRVLCLNGRQIAFGAPDEVLTASTIAATYGGSLVSVGRGPDEELVILPPAHHH